MDDLIGRQAAINAICEHGTDLERRGITVLSVANHKQATVDLLENLPSAERQGRWTYNANFAEPPFKCSACGKSQGRLSKYCPNCGARMEEN